MIENFGIIYCAMMLLQISVFSEDVVSRYRTKKNNQKAYRTSFVLTIIVFLASFVGEFAFLSNYDDFSFRILFGTTYLTGIVCLYLMCRDRVIYSAENGDFVAIKKQRKIQFNISDITRVNSSNEWLDIYLGETRIRFGNLYAEGDSEMVAYIKKAKNWTYK